MKNFIFLVPLLVLLSSCRQNSDSLQLQIDSLKQQLANSYKPGFGEFMSNVQVHHAKLWFAGQNENWLLADFEMHEIRETLEALQKYQANRKETEMLPMINLALDSMDNAIKLKDPRIFKTNYETLTNTCNSCHLATKFEFNVVKVPDTPPFSNQEFSTGKK